MKKLEVIIRPEKLDDLQKALQPVGYSGMMITEIEGHGKQKGIVQQWRGEKYKIDFLPKIKVDMVVQDKDVEQIITVIISAVKTGEMGDGKIFISNIEETIRIRTGERGNVAL